MMLKPIIKWVGGKTQILDTLYTHFPSEINNYYEPFIGGGSIAIDVTKANPDIPVWINDLYVPLYNFWVQLRDRGRDELLESQLEIASLANVTTVYQHEPNGPGHAIYQAREFCDGEPFVVIFPDDVIIHDVSATKQLLQVYREHGGSVIAVAEALDEIVHTKGIVGGEEISSGVYSVDTMIEKPALENAPSNLAIVARYVLDNDVFEYLAKECSGAGGEIQITDAIASLLGNSPIHAHKISGFHADTGNPSGMLEAAIHVAKQDPELSEVVRRTLAE